MKKIFLLLALAGILTLTGCSNRRVVTEPYYDPQRNMPAQIPARSIESADRDVPFNRNMRPRRTPQNVAPMPSVPHSSSSYSSPSGAYAPQVKTQPDAKTNRLSFHETNFDAADNDRGVNIGLAVGSINGTIVKPGEEFSFNSTIGSTVKERGYKKSIIFVDGEKSTSYGGGVCQVSTTLCNAAINAEMTITERHDHSRPVTYAAAGKEAATSHNGGLDFKFKNDKDYAVMIRAKSENGTISVGIHKHTV